MRCIITLFIIQHYTLVALWLEKPFHHTRARQLMKTTVTIGNGPIWNYFCEYQLNVNMTNNFLFVLKKFTIILTCLFQIGMYIRNLVLAHLNVIHIKKHEINYRNTQESFGCIDQIIVTANMVSCRVSGVVGGRGGGGGGAPSCRRHPPHKRPDLLKVGLVGRPSATIVTVLRLMLLQVSIQIRLLPETAVAVTTPKRSLLIMNVPHVPLEIRGY